MGPRATRLCSTWASNRLATLIAVLAYGVPVGVGLQRPVRNLRAAPSQEPHT